MRMWIGLLSIVGFLGLLATANAQTTSPSTAVTAFDGTYRFVSSAKVNPMYTARNGRMARCQGRTPGPLTIQNGQARYTAESGHELQRMVGPNGELDMRMIPVTVGGSRPMEMRAAAGIDNAGTVRLRQIGSACMISSDKSNKEREARAAEWVALPQS
jgi:hypothetical protein